MICVPDAALLPSTPRPVRRENSAMISGAKPPGNVGNARSITMPIISQCPVTESFPADASAMRPIAAVGAMATVGARCTSGPEPIDAIRSKPRLRSAGSFSGTCFAILPTVLLP